MSVQHDASGLADLALVDTGAPADMTARHGASAPVIEPCGCEASEEAERLLGLVISHIDKVDLALGDEIAAYLEGLERARAERAR